MSTQPIANCGDRRPWLKRLVPAGLVFAAITDSCAMGMLIAKMPWNHDNSMSAPSVKPALWHGIPRETILGFPTVNQDKGTSCELCFVVGKMAN